MGVKNTLLEELYRMKHLMVYETGQYKPLLEDEKKPTDAPVEKVYIDKKVEFGPGYYDLKGTHNGRSKSWKWDIPSNLNPELEKIKNFLQKNPTGYIVNVKLYAGESQIPNVDRTKYGAKKQFRVKPKYLSNARLNVIKDYISNVLAEWKKQGIINSDVKFEVNDPVVGSTPWVGQDFCPKDRKGASTDPEGYNCSKVFNTSPNFQDLIKKYTDEQYLRVVMSVDKIVEEPEEEPKGGEGGTDCFCTDEDGNKVKVEKNKDGTCPPCQETNKDISECIGELSIRVWVKTHECQNAEFFILANGVLLQNTVGGITANLNNADAYRGVPTTRSLPVLDPEALNPGYGYLPNGDGTFSYGKDKIDKKGNLRGGRSDTFILDKELVKKVLEKSDQPGIIRIWMVATTKNAHKDLPMVTIRKNNKKIYDDKPKVVKGNLVNINICENKVIPGTNTAQPEMTESLSKLLALKRQVMAKLNGDDPTRKVNKRKQLKIDGKGILLDRTAELLDEMTVLLKYLRKKLPIIAFSDPNNSPYKNSTNKEFKEKWKKENNYDNWSKNRDEMREELKKYFNNFIKLIDPIEDVKIDSDGSTIYKKGEEDKEGNPVPETEVTSPSLQINYENIYNDSPGENKPFISKVINNHELYGDVKDDLFRFYKAFIPIYKVAASQATYKVNNNFWRSTGKEDYLQLIKLLNAKVFDEFMIERIEI